MFSTEKEKKILVPVLFITERGKCDIFSSQEEEALYALISVSSQIERMPSPTSHRPERSP